jgi:hypothetical protein
MIEGETYYRAVGRSIHLDSGRAGQVARSEAWESSSYPGLGPCNGTTDRF